MTIVMWIILGIGNFGTAWLNGAYGENKSDTIIAYAGIIATVICGIHLMNELL